jgi:hypothetical protein
MKKEIKDDKVAVLYSPGYGAGWYSWNGRKELLFDPSIVYMVEQMNADDSSRDSWVSNIIEYVKQTYGDDIYCGGAEDLVVAWLPVGTDFMIDEYDGSEGLLVKEEEPWITA